MLNRQEKKKKKGEGIQPPASCYSRSAKSLPIPFPVWSNLTKWSAFTRSPSWLALLNLLHLVSPFVLPEKARFCVTCSHWRWENINSFQSSVYLTSLGVGSSLPTQKTSFLSSDSVPSSRITSWLYSGFAGCASSVHPCGQSVLGLLSQVVSPSHSMCSCATSSTFTLTSVALTLSWVSGPSIKHSRAHAHLQDLQSPKIDMERLLLLLWPRPSVAGALLASDYMRIIWSLTNSILREVSWHMASSM